jgi:hypothetical protein
MTVLHGVIRSDRMQPWLFLSALNERLRSPRSPHAPFLPRLSMLIWDLSIWCIIYTADFYLLNCISSHFTDTAIPDPTPAPSPSSSILVNEPWDRIPMDVLKDFYWQSYQIVQKGAPDWITLLHDSFRLSVGVCASWLFPVFISVCVFVCVQLLSLSLAWCPYFFWQWHNHFKLHSTDANTLIFHLPNPVWVYLPRR